jgi:hypothetical protein
MLIWAYHDPLSADAYYVMLWACLIAGFIKACLEDWRESRG